MVKAQVNTKNLVLQILKDVDERIVHSVNLLNWKAHSEHKQRAKETSMYRQNELVQVKYYSPTKQRNAI